MDPTNADVNLVDFSTATSLCCQSGERCAGKVGGVAVDGIADHRLRRPPDPALSTSWASDLRWDGPPIRSRCAAAMPGRFCSAITPGMFTMTPPWVSAPRAALARRIGRKVLVMRAPPSCRRSGPQTGRRRSGPRHGRRRNADAGARVVRQHRPRQLHGRPRAPRSFCNSSVAGCAGPSARTCSTVSVSSARSSASIFATGGCSAGAGGTSLTTSIKAFPSSRRVPTRAGRCRQGHRAPQRSRGPADDGRQRTRELRELETCRSPTSAPGLLQVRGASRARWNRLSGHDALARPRLQPSLSAVVGDHDGITRPACSPRNRHRSAGGEE